MTTSPGVCALHPSQVKGDRRFNLDDWEDLAGYVAAEANHAKNKKLQRELSELDRRIWDILESYTDQD